MEWIKDPQSILDFTFDWSEWLPNGDTISSYELIVSPTNHNGQLAIEQSTLAAGKIVVWLSQGRVNKRYKLTCRITTVQGRTEDSTRIIRIKNK